MLFAFIFSLEKVCFHKDFSLTKVFLPPKVKEALAEQYVLQQLVATQENPVFYWATEKGTAEVDFVLQLKQIVIPIEAKAEKNLKAKSLKVYVEQFQSEQVFRFSMADYREQD